MTNKEAIEHLTELKTLRIEFPNALQEQALELAIEALKDKGYAQGYIDGQTGADYDDEEYD